MHSHTDTQTATHTIFFIGVNSYIFKRRKKKDVPNVFVGLYHSNYTVVPMSTIVRFGHKSLSLSIASDGENVSPYF